MKLLLVEDNHELALWLGKVLREEQFTLDCVADGESAVCQLAQSRYDLLLLDLKLPGIDGRSVLRRMRREGDGTPVLVLTASSSLDIKVESLEIGADDYLVKPFEVRELVARIKVLIRRRGGSSQSTLQCADLRYDLDTREFAAAGAPLALTPREHRVLETLMLRPGRTVSKTQLAQAVFGPGEEAGEDAIEIYVHRLRRKLEGSQARIVTLRGLGYLLREPAAE
jgi:DNA-binding response OmpR family regulator